MKLNFLSQPNASFLFKFLRGIAASLLFLAGYLSLTFITPNICHAQTNPPLTFTWVKPSDSTISGYRIYYRTPTGGYNATNRFPVSDPAATSYTTTSLAAGTYYFQMTSINAAQGESIPSNEVTVFSAKPTLETGRVPGKDFVVEIFAQNTTANPLVNLTVTAGSNGLLKIPCDLPLPAKFDLRLKAVGFLRKTFLGVNNYDTSDLTSLTAGDITNDNIVNSGDWNALSTDWFQPNKVSDLTQDGITNGADYDFVSKHYFAEGSK